MDLVKALAVLGLLINAAGAVGAQETAAVPAALPPVLRADLNASRDALFARIDAFNLNSDAFSARCDSVGPDDGARGAACARDFQVLSAEKARLESDKQTFNNRVAAASIVVSDPNVVDARVAQTGREWADQIPELARSPAADRIAKGYAAILQHDWALALAWWQDALNRDPGNVPLQRGIALARFTIAYRRQAAVDAAAQAALARELEAEFDTTYRALLIEQARRERSKMMYEQANRRLMDYMAVELDIEIDRLVREQALQHAGR